MALNHDADVDRHEQDAGIVGSDRTCGDDVNNIYNVTILV